MEWKVTKAYSIIHFKCPYCHEGDFFSAHPYNLAKTGDTPDNCPVCKGKFAIEPGFYYGAMYVSYAIGVGVSVASWVALHTLAPTAPLWAQVSVVLATLVMGGPFFYALSKIIWANMFLAYRGRGVAPRIVPPAD